MTTTTTTTTTKKPPPQPQPQQQQLTSLEAKVYSLLKGELISYRPINMSEFPNYSINGNEKQLYLITDVLFNDRFNIALKRPERVCGFEFYDVDKNIQTSSRNNYCLYSAHLGELLLTGTTYLLPDTTGYSEFAMCVTLENYINVPICK